MHTFQVSINFLLAFIFLVILEKDLAWLGLALLFSHLLILVLSLYHQLRNLPFIINIKYFYEISKISLPLTPRVLIGFIGTQFDKIIISQVSSLETLGIYSIAHRVSMIVYMFSNALGRVWTPKLFEHLFGHPESNTKFIEVYMYISFIPAIILILFSKEVLLLFPESYGWGYIIIIFLTIYYSILFIGKINGPQLIYAKKSWLISWLSLANITISVAITYPLALKYDATGAASGMLITGFLMGIIYLLFANKYAPIIWNYIRLIKIFMFLIVASLFVIISHQTSISYTLELSIKTIILILFILYGYTMKFVKSLNFS